MKTHNTQKLFWKKWPYKAIVEITPARGSHNGWGRANNSETLKLRSRSVNQAKAWCSKTFEDVGLRSESNLSVFLSTEEELNSLIAYFGDKVLETWSPVNISAKDLMLNYEYDVIRSRPWYGRFSIRARIKYNNDFRVKAVDNFKSAVNALDPDDWYCAGLLMKIIKNDIQPRTYGWGQPLHLYLASSDDAAMLRLQCGDYIERFERIRPPE
jgi:hypothetical protein